MTIDRRGQLQADRPDRMTGHVVRVVRDARDRGNIDWRRVRMRRPRGWSREDFSSFLLVHLQRGDWTFALERDGDIATVVLGDRLLDDGGDDAGT